MSLNRKLPRLKGWNLDAKISWEDECFGGKIVAVNIAIEYEWVKREDKEGRRWRIIDKVDNQWSEEKEGWWKRKEGILIQIAK